MEKRNNAKAQHLVIVLLILLSIVTFYYLYLHLISQIHYMKAIHQIQDKQYNAAADELKKSIRHEPNNPLPWKNLGQAHHELAVLKPIKEAFDISKKARDYYLTAEKLNPLDAETAYYLAREEVRLEKLADYLAYLTNKKQDHSYQALPYFEKAIRLSPNAVGYHFDMAIYLYSQGRKDELLTTIKTLVRIYPPIYYSLKKNPYGLPLLRRSVKRVLHRL